MSGVNECAIDWVRGDTYAGVTAHNNSRLKGRIEKLAESRPEEVQIITRNEDGSIFAHVPVRWVKVSPTRKVSEVQRQAAGERMRAYQQSRKDSEDDDVEFEDEDEEEDDPIISNGYCMAVHDFLAECVQFNTVSVTYVDNNTIPWYTVELPDGEYAEYNEPDLKHTKEEVEKMCEVFNEEHKEDREHFMRIKPNILFVKRRDEDNG